MCKLHWTIPDEIHTPSMEGIAFVWYTGSADFKIGIHFDKSVEISTPCDED